MALNMRRLKLEDLKEIIAGKRPDKLEEPEESEVARFLAQAKDKKSPLFNGVSSADLLALGLDDKYDSEKRFCRADVFRKFMTTCEKVSGNKFLSGYCTKNLERLRASCTSNGDWLYKRLVIDSMGWYQYDEPRSDVVYSMAKRLIDYALDNQKTSLSPEEIVNEQKSFAKFEENACVHYLEKLDDLFVIDKDGKNTYAYLKSVQRFEDVHLGRFCAAILKR